MEFGVGILISQRGSGVGTGTTGVGERIKKFESGMTGVCGLWEEKRRFSHDWLNDTRYNHPTANECCSDC